MKIAIVFDGIYPYAIGGIEKRNWEIAKRLVLKGHEIHMFGMKDWKGEKDFIKEGVYIHGVGTHIKRYTKSGIRSIKVAILFSFFIFPPLLHKKFDILVCANVPYFHLFPVKIISLIKKKPLIVEWSNSVWGNYWYAYLGYLGIFGKFVEKICGKISNKTIAISNTMKDELIKMGATKDNIKVIPYGVDIERVDKISQNPQKIDVLFVSRLVSYKNPDVLIKAIQMVRKNIPNVNCYIIGDGPEKQKLFALTKELNLEENVKFTGFMESEEIFSFMKSSKIFVFPSTVEGFGMVIIEAFACGLPVIGINSQSSRCVSELIEDGKNGFLLNKLDENMFAEKITLLLKDENLRNKMGNNGKNIANKYDWDKITNEVEKLYIDQDEQQ